jgi:acyl-CoA synthetase (NDP forming)/GNAT superfamily N-acetyltransferase
MARDVNPGRSVLLRDGSIGLIREVSASDRGELLALHEGLSPRTLYLRFFSASKVSAARYVERLVRPDALDHGGLVLLVGGKAIGVAAYECLDPPSAGVAECAFAVADDQHGRGIGTLLLEHLASLARRRGITRFVAETLPENAVMLGVFSEAGYEVTFKRSLDTVEVSIDLKPGLSLLRVLDRRERAATVASLRPLLQPRSIAVVGASARRDSVGGAVIHNVVKAAFDGPIYPINPRVAAEAGQIEGLTTYARLIDVPGPVDLVVAAVPPQAVLDTADACGVVGAKALVVVSAGFADVGPEGALLQEQLREKVRAAGVRLVGPNCLGVTSNAPGISLAATFAPNLPIAGRVGVLSQSGGLGIALLEHTRQAGIGLSSFVSVGNKADVSGNDLLSWWDDDPATDIAVLYLESFGNPRKFARLARHVALRKPVVAIKAGRTAVGARAAQSHTAAAATPARSVAALFRQSGVINVDHVGELVDVLTLLSTQPLPTGPRLAIIGNAGGPGVLAADSAFEFGLAVAVLPEETQARLRAVLPRGAAVGNPVDTIASANGAQFGAAVSILLADPAVDAVLAVITPTPLTKPGELADALAAAAEGSPKPVLATLVGSDTVTGVMNRESGHPIPVYAFPELATRALSRASEYQQFRDRPAGTVPVFEDIKHSEARRIIAEALKESPEGRWLEPNAAEALLAAYGIQAVPSRVVTSRAAAEAAALELGLPVVVKAIAPNLVHKTDVGGVALNLGTADAVGQAFKNMQTTIGGQLTGALVQSMAAPGVETIVGVTSDPSFGPLVMFGLGGVLADLLADQAFRLVPLTDTDADELLAGGRAAPMLAGYRGARPADVGALKDLLLRVAQLADDNPELVELDLNPVVATAQGVAVLDTKIRVASSETRADAYSRQLR